MRIEVLSSGSEKGNCYAVSDGATGLLLDVGISRKQIAESLHKLGGLTVDAALVSHSHLDHSRAVKELLRLGADVRMSKGTAEALGVDGRAKVLTANVMDHIGSWVINPFKVEHDAPDPLGFRLWSERDLEAILYATDCQYIKPLWGDGCSVVMVEANYDLARLKVNVSSGEIDKARKHRALWCHQSIDTVCKFLQEMDRSRLEQVILLHLSDANSDEADFKRRVQEICGCTVRIA